MGDWLRSLFLSHPSAALAASRRGRNIEKTDRFRPKTFTARSGNFDHQFLQSKYAFSSSQCVLTDG
ncbi:unnamed protein product [Prunus armeniaca]